ncbi:hypothetical protein BFP72_09310 [Reichenbachiella sp. 5M10]|uniref:NirD/YgiW/YdeI family stress tolerance protein n=1 Tax=Reichenbachiella sp. 5M10 TaxID=1889772 RepID=UPI000C153E76|nr:NirD/YgiW/YdeI family stress tolerance protein [Reichenbachiella sp. 5M10]PIB35575.1 hypothetical protein BFP72_09310 [Reichenbachiella sp. 5M10]
MKSLLFIAVLIVSLPLVSFGQYTGPNTKHQAYTVAQLEGEVKTLTKSEKTFAVAGFIIEQLPQRNMYLFQDHTGVLNVEIIPDNLPNIPFDENYKVMLIGHLKFKKDVYMSVSKTLVIAHKTKHIENHHGEVIAPLEVEATPEDAMEAEEEMMEEETEEDELEEVIEEEEEN